MEIDRRRLFALVAGLLAAPDMALAAPSGRFASARFDASGASVALVGLDGRELGSQPLPTRGHGLALSPDGRTLVVVARRPDRWAFVFTVDGLAPLARLDLPTGRHFYGHGCFSADGTRFYTTENDTDGGDGLIGIWDATRGFARIAERRSGGVGPHDIALMPDGRHIIVANGGIRTQPETGRDILNRDTMHPNLALLALDHDEVIAVAALGADLRLSSIRHLAVAPDGEVVFGCQFEGDKDVMPLLVGAWRPAKGASAPTLWDMPDPALSRLSDYVGSVALDASGRIAAATSPRGGAAAFFERASGRFLGLASLPDVCGVASPAGETFLLSSGLAGVRQSGAPDVKTPLTDLGPKLADYAWDNHMLFHGA
jgi:uncharacterized protein